MGQDIATVSDECIRKDKEEWYREKQQLSVSLQQQEREGFFVFHFCDRKINLKKRRKNHGNQNHQNHHPQAEAR